MKFTLYVWLWLLIVPAVAQPVFHIDSLPAEGVLLDKGWKFHTGDNPDWAKPDFDDSGWEAIDPTKDIFELPQLPKIGQIGWLRIHLSLDSIVLQNQLALIIQQSIASEYYLNGKLIQRFGKISRKPNEIEAFDPLWKPVSFPANKESSQTLAIRFVLKPAIQYTTIFETSNPITTIQLLKSEEAVTIYTNLRAFTERFTMIQLGIWVMLFVLNFIFFLPNRHNKSRLYFAVFSLFFLVGDVIQLNLYILENDVANKFYVGNWVFAFYIFGEFSLMAAIYAVFERKRDLVFWLVAGYIIPALLLDSLVYGWGWQFGGPMLEIFVQLNIIRIAILAILKKKRSAYIIAGGAIASLLFMVLFLKMGTFYNHLFLSSLTNLRIAYYFLFVYCIPLSAFIYLGLDFAFINKVLKQKLVENEALSAEKQQILSTQNETLERQVTERTAELAGKNRDLEIEAALERVRSASLAIHQSHELEKVVSILFDELKELRVPFDSAIIYLFDKPKRNIEAWVASKLLQEPVKVNMPYDEEIVNNPIIADLWSAIEKGEHGLNKSYKEEDKDNYYRYEAKYNKAIIPDSIADFQLQAESWTTSFATEKNSIVAFDNWEGYLTSSEDFQLLKRFATVFEQAYIRFLDLQKAEAQLREAQIEAALERVRARSLAMQKSAELRHVVSTVVERMIDIGLNIASANIVLFNEQDRGIVSWTKTNTDDVYSNGFQWPYNDDPAVADFFDAIEQRTPLFTKNYTFDEKNAFWKNNFERSDFRNVPADRKKFILNAAYFSLSLACRNKSGIVLTRYTQEPFSDSDHDILQRFAKVFEQAYIRFLDLKKAEAQALDVLRRTTLDRVRAEIASMRTTGDLERITPLIWNELTTLGVPFIRCGVFIMDEEQEQIHTFLSSPDGKAIASFNTPFSNPGVLTEALPHWRNKEIYKTHWDEATFLAQAQTLIGQGAISSPETYLTENRPTSLYLHLLPFLQGMLYVGSDTAPLTDDQLSLVQTLADAFSTAYARYEDFNKLEVAKKRVESTLTELKFTQAQLIQKEKLASLGELTAGIAHEIQNPLNFVNNFSEVSTELIGELKEEAQAGRTDDVLAIADNLTQNLEKITLHGQRASNIVKGMLEHSRTSTGQKELTNLNTLADEYLRLAYQGFRRSGVPAKNKTFNCKLVTDFAPDLAKVEVVPQEFGRVLLNLYNNAFYAVQQGVKSGTEPYEPTVSVTTTEVNGQVETRVRDNGMGIPESIQAKIFQPFFTTKPTGEGTGLGLSLSYDIVTKGHGGTLSVESVEGEGTTFIITLPA